MPVVSKKSRADSKDRSKSLPFRDVRLSRVNAYLARLGEVGDDEEKQRAVLDEVPESEIALLIEQWTKRAGFSGLEYEERGRIFELITNWYAKSPQAALDWVLAIQSKKDRQELISQIVGKEAEVDLGRALELAKRYGGMESGGLDMPSEVAKRLGGLDADQFVEALLLFSSAGSSRGGSPINFAEGFDFLKAAELLKNRLADGEGACSISWFPTNFIEELTTRDPDSTWNWISSVSQKPGFMWSSQAGVFFKALRKVSSPDEFNRFVIEKMEGQTDADKKFETAFWALSADVNEEQISEFVRNLPGDRAKNLEHLIQASCNKFGGRYDEYKEALLQPMVPEERARIVAGAFIGGISAREKANYSKILKRLGHSDEEIGRMFPVPEKE